MDVNGQIVRFYLSPQGRSALEGLAPASGSFQALVIETGNLGLLVWRLAKGLKSIAGPVPVLLLKWDYIATMTYNYQIEPPAKAQIGFTSRGVRARGRARSYRKQD